MSEPRLSFRTSNRLEILVEHLAATLVAEPLPPLEREVVVVQSQGMVRWVTFALADALGITANLATPFPASLCHYLADQLLADDAALGPLPADLPRGPSLFDRELLTWRIFHRLGAGGASLEGLDAPRAYLDDDPDQIRRHQLSVRLARLFDDYQLFRPRTMLEWEEAAAPPPASTHAGWQARLWRSLAADAGEEPLARRLTRLLDLLRRARRAPPGLPRRLAVFGVSTLPPVFLEIASALARFLPVTVYFLSPTYQYWGDVRSEREAARIRSRLQTSRRGGDQHLEGGNALLAGLGRQGRQFFDLLQDADAEGAAWHELDFVDPGDGCLLHALQSDVLHLVDRGGPGASPRRLAAGDDSLQVHACHSPRREMEVLRDQLLAAFDRDPELAPSDVLVMVPDLDDYGPWVEAVFGVEWEGTPRLPFAIADRRAGLERPPADTILQILDLVASRVTPRAVFDLLDTPAIRRRFRLAGGDVPLLARWVADSRIRWGVDGAQRAADFALPGDDANTWRAGLDRLLMGYAAGNEAQLVGGVAPRAGDSAAGAELLGHLAAFADALFSHLERLRDPRPPEAWARDLGAALDALYRAEGEDEERALDLVRDALEDLDLAGTRAGVDEPLTLKVVRAHLARRLAGDGSGTGFLSGRITFCAARPMRSLPFEVICFAGLADGAFPRRDPRHDFDLMAPEPRPGDRSLTADDRQIFLETLLAAGERLILTYEGRSQKDGRRKAPAAVVSELLDVLDRAFETADGRPAREHVVVEHRLHPENPAYFGAGDDPRLFSYSRESCRASRVYGARQTPEPFVPVSEAGGEAAAAGEDRGGSLEVELSELTELWVHPAKHYCRRVLRLTLDAGEREAEEAEPFDVDFLERYRLRQWLLERRLATAPPGPELEILRRRGELPLAGLGSAHFTRLERDALSFAATLPDFEPREPTPFVVAGDGWRLHGRFDELTDSGALRFRCADLKPKDLAGAWVAHVARCAAAAPRSSDPPLVTRVFGTDRAMRFGPLDEAPRILARLIEGYREGLRRPLPLFEKASHAYVEQRRRLARGSSRSRASPVEAARRAFAGSRFPGDAADPYVALCFRDRDPLAEDDFARWADALWTPLLDHAEVTSAGAGATQTPRR